MIQNAEKLQTNQVESVSGIPVDPAVIFTDKKNQRKASVEKRQRKLLADVGSFIKPFLLPGEKVLLVTTACSPMSFLEQYLTGWVIYYLKRAYLVFTDQRILHVPTTYNYKYRQSIARILHSDCTKLSSSWWSGALSVQYKGGKKEQFQQISRAERAKVRAILPTIQMSAAPATNPQRVHLCPRCAHELQSEKFTCPQCRLIFKDKETARRIAITYPGGGYFYLRHPWLGVSDAMVESVLILSVITASVNASTGGKEGWGPAMIMSFVLFMEKVVSVFHSNHYVEEWIPEDKNVSFRTS